MGEIIINELISEFDKDKQAKLLTYLQSSNILGNPVLEEFFMREHASVLQLMKHEELRKRFQLDMDNWITSLEPRLQDHVQRFFDDFTGNLEEHVKTVASANFSFGKALDKAVAAAEKEIEAKAIALTTNLAHVAESERRKVQEALIKTLHGKLDPHVQKAFASTTDKFTAKVILRDLAILLAGMSIFWGLTHLF